MEYAYRNYIQRELQALSLLPKHNVDDRHLETDHSGTVQAFYWILERLPRAKDAQPTKDHPVEAATKDASPIDTQGDASKSSNEDGEGDVAAGAGVLPSTRQRPVNGDDASSSSSSNNSENESLTNRKSVSRQNAASQKALLRRSTRRRTASVRD